MSNVLPWFFISFGVTLAVCWIVLWGTPSPSGSKSEKRIFHVLARPSVVVIGILMILLGTIFIFI